MGQLNEGERRLFRVGDQLVPVTRRVTAEKMVEFERVVWDRGRNSHSDPEVAKRDGLARPIASGQNQMAFLHELLELNFGDAWVYGGKISVRNIHPVYSGDLITPQGVVAEVTEVDGKVRVTIDICCKNQADQKTSAGTAWVGQPSAARSWIPSNTEATA